MTLLIIAYVLYSLLSLPTFVRFGQFVMHDETNGWLTLLSFVALVFVIWSLISYMSSIGHGVAALVILIPSMVALIVGFVVGMVGR